MRRFGSRLLAAALLVSALVVGSAVPAAAHALRVSSDPDAGAVLAKAPPAVTVTFGEEPDPNLSSLRVLDSSGHNVATSKTHPVPGQPLTLAIALGPLPNGVYTVAWTTVSKVDGHLASGTFAFGIGVAPSALTGAAAAVRSPGAPDLSTASRWALYVGLMLLVGLAVCSFACLRAPPRRWGRIAAIGFAAGAAGAAGIAFEAARTAHVGLGHLLSTSFGHQLQPRLDPLIAGAVLAAGLAITRRPRAAVAVCGLAGLISMWGDVDASHAAAATHYRVLRMLVQWLHFASAGVWIGGLATLLLGIGALAADDRRVAATRYSRLALASVVVLAASGAQRALDEVGRWGALTSSAFGRYVVVKSALLVVLLGLGAVNRYRSVSAAARSVKTLTAVGRTEIGVAVVVLVFSGLLQGLAPPSSAPPGPPKPLTVTGQDFATTVKVRLSISPGTAGFNTFSLQPTNFDTGKPAPATSVSITFTLPSRPDLGSSTLTLQPANGGLWTATGANLSINGSWSLTVLVQEATDAKDITLTAATRVPHEKITVERISGNPDLYTISLVNGDALQVYLDPGHPGLNEFHATYIGADGNELPMRTLTVTATGPPGARSALTVRRLDNFGHYVADLPSATPGQYRFELDGTATDGSTFDSTITIPVK